MRVRVCAVDEVAVKRERRSRFDGGFQNEAHDVLDGNGALGNAAVVHAVAVAFFPFVAPKIFEPVAFDGMNVVRAHQVPVLIEIFLRHFPE